MTQADIPRSVRPPASAARRLRTRFADDLPLSYRTLDRTRRSGDGRIINLSSNGALVACCQELAAKYPVLP